MNLNFLIAGQPYSSIDGNIGVHLLNEVYNRSVLSLTEDGFHRMAELRPLSQALNLRRTEGAPRMFADGVVNAVTFSVQESLSAFQVVANQITLIQAELNNVVHDLVQSDNIEDDDDDIDEYTVHISLSLDVEELGRVSLRLSSINAFDTLNSDATEEEVETVVGVLLAEYGPEAFEAAILAEGIDYETLYMDPTADVYVQSPEELIEEIEEALGDIGVAALVNSFGQPEVGNLAEAVEKFGPEHVVNKLHDLGYELPSDIDEEEEEDFIEDDDDEEEEETHFAKVYSLETNDLEALANALGVKHEDRHYADIIKDIVAVDEDTLLDAFEVAQIHEPATEERSVEDYADRWRLLSGLTAMQSALTAALAQNETFTISFTH